MGWIQVLRRLEATPVPRVAAERWGADPGSVQPVSVGANAIYRFAHRGGTGFLRIIHPRGRGRAELEANLAYLNHLYREGAPVNEPLRSRSGAWIEAVEHDAERWLATAVGAVPGEPVTHRCTDPTVYRAWGAAMARLHVAAETFRPTSTGSYYGADREWREICERLPLADEVVRAEAERVGAWRAQLERDAAGFGITHGDFNAGNAIWDGESVRVVDFDEPSLHWYAADVARPFNEVRDRAPDQIREWVDALVSGYRQVRVLPERLVRDIPWFLRLRVLAGYLWLLAEWKDEETIGGGSRQAELALVHEQILHPLHYPGGIST